VPIQRVVWRAQGVKVYDPEPADAETCELFSGRKGVSARIVKIVARGVIPRLIGRRQELITLTFKKRVGEPPIEKAVQKEREVKDFA
jgi:hypothetical protein